MQALARSTNAIILKSTDLVERVDAIGTCSFFRQQMIDVSISTNTSSTRAGNVGYVFFEGCDPTKGSTIVLRGGPYALLKRLKRVAKLALLIAYNLRLETALYTNQGATSPLLTVPNSPGLFKMSKNLYDMEKEKASNASVKSKSTWSLLPDLSESLQHPLLPESTDTMSVRMGSVSRSSSLASDAFFRRFSSHSTDLLPLDHKAIAKHETDQDFISSLFKTAFSDLMSGSIGISLPQSTMITPLLSSSLGVRFQPPNSSLSYPAALTYASFQQDIDEENLIEEILPSHISGSSVVSPDNVHRMMFEQMKSRHSADELLLPKHKECRSKIEETLPKEEIQHNSWTRWQFEHFQALVFAFVSVTHGGRVQCAPIALNYLKFYVAGDHSLGQFLANNVFCFSHGNQFHCLSPLCKETLFDHTWCFMHSDGAITMNVKKVEDLNDSEIPRAPRETLHSQILVLNALRNSHDDTIMVWTKCNVSI